MIKTLSTLLAQFDRADPPSGRYCLWCDDYVTDENSDWSHIIPYFACGNVRYEEVAFPRGVVCKKSDSILKIGDQAMSVALRNKLTAANARTSDGMERTPITISKNTTIQPGVVAFTGFKEDGFTDKNIDTAGRLIAGLHVQDFQRHFLSLSESTQKKFNAGIQRIALETLYIFLSVERGDDWAYSTLLAQDSWFRRIRCAIASTFLNGPISQYPRVTGIKLGALKYSGNSNFSFVSVHEKRYLVIVSLAGFPFIADFPEGDENFLSPVELEAAIKS